MIVFRNGERTVSTNAALTQLTRDFRRLEASPSPSGAIDLLISFGEFEAGAVDALNPTVEKAWNETRALREAAVALGRVCSGFWRGEDGAPRIQRLGAAMEKVAKLALPSRLRIPLSEGFAYYALQPETYARSAERFFNEVRPENVVVIGIRGIGASLSAITAAVLEDLGAMVRSSTVRPHGHPFERKLQLDEPTRDDWRGSPGAWFAVVDEGPGLSGSSFASVAEELTALGIPEDRIVLFPSWDADPDRFVNASAGDRWRRHRRFVEPEIVPDAVTSARDLSAGAWRPLFYTDERDYPAVQPQHEARKYLTASNMLFKFSGLGHYGEHKRARAEQLSAAGYSPAIDPKLGAHGYLAFHFVEGSPLAAGASTRPLLDRIAAYLAYRKGTFLADRSVTFEQMLEMILVNAKEGLGRDPDEIRRPLERFRVEFNSRGATEVDGRMMPHEWIETAGGILKTDAIDHHADHFFPGCADIAWDLAAGFIEFRLGDHDRRYLADQYRALSRDHLSVRLLNFYEVAYLAFRLGYAAMAADSTVRTPEFERFAVRRVAYARLLSQSLAPLIEG